MAEWTKSLLCAVLLFAWNAGALVSAQSSSGAVTIELTDPYAKPISGAAVALRSEGTGDVAQPNTVDGGAYRFTQLKPGAYALVLTSQLGQQTLSGIEIAAGREVQVQVAVMLAVVAREELVSNQAIFVPATFAIHGGAGAIRVAAFTAQTILRADPVYRVPVETAESMSQDPAVPAEQIEILPLAGRDWQSLFSGATATAAQAEGDNQQPEREPPSILIDGMNTALAFGNNRGRQTRGPGAVLIGPGANESSVREVQEVQSSDRLTGGRDGFGRLVVTTERGGNKIHGHESIVDRQNMLVARNPFTQWVKETALATATTIPVFTPTPYSPESHEMTWSLGAGGPILRHKLFWFTSIEYSDRNDPAVSTVRHPDNFFAQPSNDDMQVLSARLGLSSTNPIVEGLGAYSGILESLDGLLGPGARLSKRGTGFARGDWILSERQRFTLEGAAAIWHAFGGAATRASENYGTHSYGSQRVDDQWMLARWEAFPGRDLAVVTQVSAGRQFVAGPAEPPSKFEQSFNSSNWGRLPQITVDSRYGFTIGNPARFGPGGYPDEHLYQAQEQLDRTWPGLQLRAGLSVRHNNDATGFLRNQTGTYHYASIENFASDALSFAAFGLSG